ncbi:MAG: hypothetical protein Q7O66_08915, partial [Dehalococcoidia bacterium]|nr:hypothetical protein [Dehalococcoidia bacterium]
MSVVRKNSLAIAALLVLASAFWSAAGPSPIADADGGGTFPDQPFNGLQIKYSISGATLGTSKEGGSFDWGLTYSGGATTGNVLTVSGTATSTGCMTELTVSLEGGDARTNPPVFRKGPVQASPNPFNESFSISTPIPPDAMGASFNISLIMRCPGGNNRSIGVSGNFAGPGTRITPTPTLPDCFANIIVPENLKPGDQLAPTAEVFDPSRKPVQAKKIVWQIGGKETNSVVWDGMTTEVLLRLACPNNSIFTKDLIVPMAAPIKITGKVSAEGMLGEASRTLPIQAVKVVLLQKNKVLTFTYTDKEGAFALQAPITDSLTISVSLILVNGQPPPFVVVHEGSLVPASVMSKPFELTKDSPNPTTMDISFSGDKIIPGPDTPEGRINDLGAVYYFAYQAWETAAVRLKQSLDYNLPLYIRAFGSCGESSNWSDPRYFP